MEHNQYVHQIWTSFSEIRFYHVLTSTIKGDRMGLYLVKRNNEYNNIIPEKGQFFVILESPYDSGVSSTIYGFESLNAAKLKYKLLGGIVDGAI